MDSFQKKEKRKKFMKQQREEKKSQITNKTQQDPENGMEKNIGVANKRILVSKKKIS